MEWNVLLWKKIDDIKKKISPFYTTSLWLKAKNSFKDFFLDDQPGDKVEKLHSES